MSEKVIMLEDIALVLRRDLRDCEVLNKSRPASVGTCSGSEIYQYKGTNIVQWWINVGNTWKPYGKVFKVKPKYKTPNK